MYVNLKLFIRVDFSTHINKYLCERELIDQSMTLVEKWCCTLINKNINKRKESQIFASSQNHFVVIS